MKYFKNFKLNIASLLPLLLFIYIYNPSHAQELNATITVNALEVAGASNNSIYKTLESALNEFINQKQWTKRNFNARERINCDFTIIINGRTGNNFSGSLQIIASRPVYNTTYTTTTFNHKDENFVFNYQEYDPLIYNENRFESNLISVISFYIYTILGIDADSFALNGGQQFLEKAQDIAIQAQQGGFSGWEANRNKQNRYALIDQLLSQTQKEYRQAMYQYHRKGLDVFQKKPLIAKKTIKESLLTFENIYNKRMSNLFLIRIFTNAKADEIVDIFNVKSEEIETKKLKEVLNKIAPNFITKWRQIK